MASSKRDLLVVRLAIKWKWLTPEEGEDVLFLKRKFGAKLTVEQIVRRRGYLDWEELDQLAEAATAAMGRRARPGADVAPTTNPQPGRPALEVPEAAVLLTEPRSERGPVIDPSDDDDPFRDEGKTVIASMPDLRKAALARTGRPPSDDPDRTIHDAPLDFIHDFGDDDESREHTVYQPRPPFSSHDSDVIERVEARIDPASLDADTDESLGIGGRPAPLNPAFLREIPSRPLSDDALDPDSMPGESLAKAVLGRGLAIPSRIAPGLTIVRDEAGVEFLDGEFGPYSIRRVIARGRTSIVYLALHRESGTEVALKVLNLPAAAASRFFAERGDELLEAARLTSPLVVRTLDVGHVGQKYYVALQYVDGWTLEEMLDAGDRPSHLRVAEIGRDLSVALAAGEDLGILHLDVRPDHVLIPDSGQALLTGFGFAPHRPGFPAAVRGTPEYMAPEQLLGSPDARTDLYGLGVTLYRVLTGGVPGDAIDPTLPAQASMDVPPPDPRDADPSIPEALALIVLRLLAKRPDARFQSAVEVHDAFDQLLFEMEAAGFQEPPAPTPSMRPLMVQAALGSLGLVGVALVAAIALDTTDLWSGPEAARRGAFIGMAGSIAASILLSTVALIRRGQIPLPLSSAWLVRLQESLGALGSLALIAGFVLAPPAVLNVTVGSIAIVVLTSGVFGTLLRKAIARSRADGGVGRMLAVLGDPMLGSWRAVHVPLVVCMTALAVARFAVMAYFASA